jgi:hypothetical protein
MQVIYRLFRFDMSSLLSRRRKEVLVFPESSFGANASYFRFLPVILFGSLLSPAPGQLFYR